MWIVDLRGNRLTRYRHPRSSGYAATDESDLRQPVGIIALPDIGLDLSGLFLD